MEAIPVTLNSTNSTSSMFTTPSKVVIPLTTRPSRMTSDSVIVVKPRVDIPVTSSLSSLSDVPKPESYSS